MNTPTNPQAFGEYLANLQPTPAISAGIIAQFSEAYSALMKVYNLTDGDLGISNWFCEGYPFGMDLGEFLAEFGTYIEKLKGIHQ
jgi:hypothetical protein